VQPREILEFYRALSEVSGFELETAGVLKGGKKFWALARTGQSAMLKGHDCWRRCRFEPHADRRVSHGRRTARGVRLEFRHAPTGSPQIRGLDQIGIGANSRFRATLLPLVRAASMTGTAELPTPAQGLEFGQSRHWARPRTASAMLGQQLLEHRRRENSRSAPRLRAITT
jgi:hypothetical protein